MRWDGPDKGDPLCLSVNFSKDPAFSSSSTVYTGYSFVDAEDSESLYRTLSADL